MSFRRAALIAAILLVASTAGPLVAADRPFIRGDSNGDGAVSMADIMTVVRFLHRSENVPPCRDAADFNDSGNIDITDLVGIASFIFFLTGTNELPPSPYPAPGDDPTPDPLDCASGSRARGVGAAGGGIARLDSPCTAEDFENDTGPVIFDQVDRHGQIVDFVLFARSCLYGYPGQENLVIPVGMSNADDLDGFTLSVFADPKRIWLERFSFDDSAVSEFGPDLTYNYNHWLAEGYLAAAVFMDYTEPFFGKVFPTSRDTVHASNLELSISPEAEPGDVLRIEFETTPGLDALRPAIPIEYSVEGRSVTPIFGKRGVTIKVLPRERLFIRGDANRDLIVNISDVIHSLRFLFLAERVSCLTPLDTNADGRVNLTDPISLIDFLFRRGPRPELPFPHPAPLPADDCRS